MEWLIGSIPSAIGAIVAGGWVYHYFSERGSSRAGLWATLASLSGFLVLVNLVFPLIVHAFTPGASKHCYCFLGNPIRCILVAGACHCDPADFRSCNQGLLWELIVTAMVAIPISMPLMPKTSAK